MRLIRQSQKYATALIAIMPLFVGPLCAQQVVLGAISGTVTDPTGAAVPDATVTIVNQDTNVSRSTATGNHGFYSVEALLSGVYTVRIKKDGFKERVTQGIQIDPGQRRANNVTLEIGSAITQVTVTADAVQTNTEASETGGTITAKQINNLMLNGRSFQSLATQVPGVNSTQGSDAMPSGGILGFLTLTVNGNSIEYSSYTIDGVYDEYTGNLENLNILPIVDGISEFRVLTGNYSAKYGMAGTGQMVIETKSGTNTFHGSVWDYLRNNAFDAKNYFAQQQALHQNIYGFTIGGPVILPGIYNTRRNRKTFFFATDQWQSINNGTSPTFGRVFTQAMRGGDFSQSPTLRPSGLTLDANSVILLRNHGRTNCISSRTKINPACIDPAAIAIMNAYLPLPNYVDPTGGTLNYINSGSQVTTQLDHQYRIDHSINDNNTLMGRVNYEEVTNGYPLDSWGGNPSPTIKERLYTTGLNALIRETSTITPRFVNTFGVSETYNKPRLGVIGGTMPVGLSINPAFPGADVHNRIPNISISKGWSGNGTGALPVTASEGLTAISDEISWIKGRHVIQAGGFHLWEVFRGNSQTRPQGSFTFNGSHTGDPAADYLLGLDMRYRQINADRYQNDYYHQAEFYVQDDWKATSRLSLNLGLRWVFFSSDYFGLGNNVTSFSPSSYDPAQAPVVNKNGTLVVNSSNVPLNSAGQPANLVNGLIFAGKNGVPKGFFTSDMKNFGPRVGFAYDLTGNGKTVLRGGYGIGYSRLASWNGVAYGTNPPFVNTVDIFNSLVSDATAGTAGAPTVRSIGTVPNGVLRPSMIQSFSLTVERQIASNVVAHVGYVGNLGHHLETFGADGNEPLPVSAPSIAGTTCLAPGQSPSRSYNYDPCIDAGLVSSNFTRPYRGYSNFQDEFIGGNSNYHSLQSGLEYRAGGSQVNLAYTYSKVLATIGTRVAGQGQGMASSMQDWRNPSAEYGPPDYDFTHNLTATWVYDIPYFRHSGNTATKLTLGGWSFAGTFLHQSGFAISPSNATGTMASRPDQIGAIHRIGMLSKWVSPSAFAGPSYGFYGSAHNGTIRGPGVDSFNVSLYKTLHIADRLNVQFRSEAFNVFNHPSFRDVNTSFGDPSFGEVFGTHDPRILEFALKLLF